MDPALQQFLFDVSKQAAEALGGFFVGFFIKDRIVRKRKLIDDCRSAIRELSAEAGRYWEKNGPQKESEDEIKKGFTRLNHLLDDLTIDHGRKDKCRAVHAAQEEFYDAATGGAFESPKRRTDADRVTRCGRCADALSETLRKL